tara:strand:+ start:619 stop:828 length:210 start_codon:yes stop_codon:yes gene_type:complete
MKIYLRIFSIILLSVILRSEVQAISNYKILKICSKLRQEKTCIRKLKFNRDQLKRGKPIEIQVIPHKRK